MLQPYPHLSRWVARGLVQPDAGASCQRKLGNHFAAITAAEAASCGAAGKRRGAITAVRVEADSTAL